MQRMSGIDPMFVYADTQDAPMEIAYACVLDPASVPGGYCFERVQDLLAARIPTLPALRRRLLPVPFGLDVPRLVDDPQFELSDHLHRSALPSPGGLEEFARKVSDVMSHPLQLDQPPWEMHVIEQLADARIGLIAKIHHAIVDGVAGAELMAQLLDVTPEGPAEDSVRGSSEGPAPAETASTWLPAGLPSGARLVSDALPKLVTSPVRAWRAGREVGRTAARLVRRAAGHETGPVSIPLGAPDTFEKAVGPRREVAFAELDLRHVRALCERYGVKVNDIVLAVCSGALRSHLSDHGEVVDRPLMAVVPVSTRDQPASAGTGRDLGNQLSAMFVPLSNEQQTPLERLRTVAAASASCKEQELAAGFGPAIALAMDAVPPLIAWPAVQLGVRSGIVRRVRAANLMVSNVPGPDFPLYFAGMRLESVYPLGPVIEGIPLNITVQGYEHSLFVGANVATRVVPDLPGLVAAMEVELARLTRMAAAPPGRNDPTHRRRRSGSGSSSGSLPPRRPTSHAQAGAAGANSSDVARAG
jgi:diacylglycerol O-acyltransferase / wax synthase